MRRRVTRRSPPSTIWTRRHFSRGSLHSARRADAKRCRRTLRASPARTSPALTAPAPHSPLSPPQFIEVRQQFIPSKTARTKPWRLNVARCSLCADVIEYFSSSNAKMKLFQRTEVTFHDASGRPEDGSDYGGLTVELYSRFFREVISRDLGLFEGKPGSIGLLPSASAPVESLEAVGRVLCKCVFDDQPIGVGLGRFVFEYLSDAHERRVFASARLALAALADFDPDLAKRWERLLDQPALADGLTLDLFDPDADDEIRADVDGVDAAVVAGCRYQLLESRLASLRALRDGFTETEDLRIQLGALSSAELLRMLRGKTELSSHELLACFAWPDVGATPVAEAQAGFAAAGCDCPRYLREIILDESADTGLSREQRLHLLEWCTALTALPCGGLKEPIALRFWAERDADALPNVHTCTHELHLPPYASREQLRAKLLLAVAHGRDGFQIE